MKVSSFFSVFCLKLTELRIEEHTLVGNSTRLECKYDLQGEKLYTVKWYKDGNEFYRFLPGETPEVQVFEVAGVHVDVSLIFLIRYIRIFFYFIFNIPINAGIKFVQFFRHFSYMCLNIQALNTYFKL